MLLRQMKTKKPITHIRLREAISLLSKLNDNLHRELFNENVYELVGQTSEEIDRMIGYVGKKFRQNEELIKEINDYTDRKMRVEKVALLLAYLHSSLHCEFLGKKPEELLATINKFNKEFSQFLSHDFVKELLRLELKIYKETDPEIYWELLHETVHELKPSHHYPPRLESVSYRGFKPIDYRDSPVKDLNAKILLKIKEKIGKEELSKPIGKKRARGRVKRDDLSSKNWPIVRKTIVEIYNLLKVFYKSQAKYPAALLKDIVILLKNEFFEEKHGIKKSLFNDLNERDIISIMQYHNK